MMENTVFVHAADFCGENMFMCVKLYHCIPANYVCDGDNDCGDMADEQNCTSTHPPCKHNHVVIGLLYGIICRSRSSIIYCF